MADFPQQCAQKPFTTPVFGAIDDDGDQMQVVIRHLDHAAAEFEESIVSSFDLELRMIPGLIEPGLQLSELLPDLRPEDRVVGRSCARRQPPASRQRGDADIGTIFILKGEAGAHIDERGYEELPQLFVAALRFKPCQPMYQLPAPP